MNISRKFRFTLGAAVLTCITTLPAKALDLYVGGLVGGSNFGSVGVVPSGATVKETDTGYKLLLGARISPNFAVEGGYTDFGKAKLSDKTTSVSISGSGIFVDVVGILPLNTDWALFGKAGVLSGKVGISASSGNQSGSLSDTGSGMRYGFGATYAVTKSVAIRAEWERSRFDVNFVGNPINGDVDLLSVGVNFSF